MYQPGEFGGLLQTYLARRSMRPVDLAATCGVHKSYISRLMKYAGASPEWVDRIAAAINATDEERTALHFAAARAHGYRV